MKNFRLKFKKTGNMIYISHLDLMRLFQRAFRRAGIMVKHTEGFNPQPKIAFATALALGTSSDGEYMDVELEEDIDKEKLKDSLNKVLPTGIEIDKIDEKREKDSIMSLIEWGQYLVKIKSNKDIDREMTGQQIENFLAKEEIIQEKTKKKKKKITTRQVNIRPSIKKLDLTLVEDSYIILKMFLKTGSNGNLKPEVVLEKLDELTELDLDQKSSEIHRVDLFIEKDGKIVTPI